MDSDIHRAVLGKAEEISEPKQQKNAWLCSLQHVHQVVLFSHESVGFGRSGQLVSLTLCPTQCHCPPPPARLGEPREDRHCAMQGVQWWVWWCCPQPQQAPASDGDSSKLARLPGPSSPSLLTRARPTSSHMESRRLCGCPAEAGGGQMGVTKVS